MKLHLYLYTVRFRGVGQVEKNTNRPCVFGYDKKKYIITEQNSSFKKCTTLTTNIESSWNRCRSKRMNYSKPPLYTLHPHSLCYAYRVGVNERSYICWIEKGEIQVCPSRLFTLNYSVVTLMIREFIKNLIAKQERKE